MISKPKRWVEKGYTRWVATHPCANCGIHDETIVPHHLKHVGMEITSGMGTKASDWMTMPLCFNCHSKLHNGDTNIKGYQFTMLYKMLDKAFNSGILVYKPKLLMSKDEQRQWRNRNLYGEQLDD